MEGKRNRRRAYTHTHTHTHTHTEAWEAFLEAERSELEQRKNGRLAKVLSVVLPGETQEESERLVREDSEKAKEGLVELAKPTGEFFYKHIDELIPEDRSARIRARTARQKWLAERTRRILAQQDEHLRALYVQLGASERQFF